jgi:phospholipase/carboxylesterase
MQYQPLKYIYKPSGAKDAPTLLLLHGTGGNENDLLPLASYFGEEHNVLSLRGNVSEQGMPRFFKRIGMGIFDEEDLRFRTHEMIAFLKETATREGFNIEKITAIGYSNGANIAGSALYLYPGFFAGAILYRPMQPFKILPSVSTQATRIFASNGLQDPTINPEATKAYIQQMESAGWSVEHHHLNTGHNLTREDLELSVIWHQRYFGDGTV